MPTDHEELEMKIPSAASAIVAEFKDRPAAEEAVAALTKAGVGTDQISLVGRGAETVNGRFIPEAMMLTIHPDGRPDEVTRVLRERGATDIKTGTVTATGEVVETEEAEREEATR